MTRRKRGIEEFLNHSQREKKQSSLRRRERRSWSWTLVCVMVLVKWLLREEWVNELEKEEVLL
jgi:hypothetical protein